MTRTNIRDVCLVGLMIVVVIAFFYLFIGSFFCPEGQVAVRNFFNWPVCVMAAP